MFAAIGFSSILTAAAILEKFRREKGICKRRKSRNNGPFN
jgi:hypothetical protein